MKKEIIYNNYITEIEKEASRKKIQELCEEVNYIHIVQDRKSIKVLKKYMNIQYCVTCMGRLCHLIETLPANLELISRYPNQSLLLLNYNSNDGLDEWIKENFMDEIQNGRLKYHYTKESKYFNASHAKNCIHRLADADILVNLDADNFLAKEFIDYIIGIFAENINSVFQGCERDTMGRIAMSRENFYKLGGYDESFCGYGEEDHDLVGRSKKIGCEIRMLGGICGFIEHSDDMRIKNHREKDKIAANEGNIKRKFYNLGHEIINPNERNGIEWGQCKLC